jgi:alpha-tubulin suppressor-like RCC1 family protein/V8-like Glu-specific endopeptidase
MRHGASSLVCLAITACGFSAPQELLGERGDPIIFGDDDRTEPFQHENQAEARRLADASVALIAAPNLDETSSERVLVSAPSLSERFGVCPDERFAAQPTAADCSGTLVAPDLVLTAGHCITAETCPTMRLVFGYAMQSDGAPRPLTSADVFRCQEVVDRRFEGALDYAIVRLERPASGHTPLGVRLGRRPLAPEAELRMAGHPSGLPQKLVDGGFVSNAREEQLDFFIANLDSFPGNSGSGVTLAAGGPLVGVVTQGPSGSYVFDATSGCQRAERVASDAPSQIISVYVQSALASFCAGHSDPWLCSCGNHSCEPERGEDSVACPEDCGSACGDGACTGDETANGCYEDCGACGNGACEQREIAELGCCSDCGCPSGFRCDGVSCQAELGNVNGDATVDEVDALLISVRAGGWPVPPFAQRTADVDCDGSVTAQDAQVLAAAGDGPLPCQRIADVALGSQHTCLLDVAGSVRCWGGDSFGQLGDGATVRGSGASARHAYPLELGAYARAVVAGAFHSCAVLEGGDVRCWGSGNFGQLGLGERTNVGDNEHPSESPALHFASPVKQLVAGATHTCALLGDGTVRCWGDNAFGQLGLGTRVNVGDDEHASSAAAVQLPAAVVSLTAGQQHTCVLLEDGRVHCWGGNAVGQLGLGRSGNVGDDELPSSVGALDLGGAARALSAGARHTCALLADGTARCWGDNGSGQLGYGHAQRIGDDETPTSAGAARLGSGVLEVKAADSRTCARYTDGSARCWGNDARGQLGYAGALVWRPELLPEALPALDLGAPVERLFAHAQQACAVGSDAGLRCWGDNGSGQLGHSHHQAVGDDETPAAAGTVPWRSPHDEGWSFANPWQLRVWQRTQGATSLEIALFVENRGRQAVGDFRALLPLRTHAAILADEATPWSTPSLRLLRPGVGLLELDFGERTLGPRALSSGGPLHSERVWLGGEAVALLRGSYAFADGWGAWFAPTERIQLVSRTDTVLYGWTRATTSE